MNFWSLAPALAAGLLLGAFFFGGLWWTVRKGVVVPTAGALVLRQPAVAHGHYLGRILFRRGRGLAAVAARVSSALSWPAWS